MLTEQIEQLPTFVQQEVLDYIDFLKAKYHLKTPPAKMKFSWRGALADRRSEFDSVTLQHKASEWR